jgi:hypothetical protein
MTWVYWDPKSRISIFECFGGDSVFTALGMSLRNSVFAGGIIRSSINRSDGSLAGRAALKLISDFVSAALFQRIGTPGNDERECADDRQGLHPLILGNKAGNATTR